MVDNRPLRWNSSVKKKHVKALEKALAKVDVNAVLGVDISDVNAVLGVEKTPQTLLVFACFGHCNLSTEVLIRARADVNLAGDGVTPIVAAAQNSNPEGVQLLLSAHADITGAPCNTTPLHCAAVQGHITVVDLLLKEGADVNMLSDEDWLSEFSAGSALVAAVQSGQLEVTQALLHAKADVHRGRVLIGTSPSRSPSTSPSPSTSLDRATREELNEEKFNEFMEHWVTQRFSEIPMEHWVPRFNHKLQAFVDAHQGPCYSTTDSGATVTSPLWFAAWAGRTAVVQLLISAKANLNHLSLVDGVITPTHVAGVEAICPSPLAAAVTCPL